MDIRWNHIWDNLVTTPHGLFTLWEERLGAHSTLSGLHFVVMQALAEAPEGRLRLQELAAAVRHSQSGTTRLVDRMEKDGLVARHFCESDRRVTWALLSPEGRRRYDAAVPEWEIFLDHYLRQVLSPEEALVLDRLLGKLQAALGTTELSCPGTKEG